MVLPANRKTEMNQIDFLADEASDILVRGAAISVALKLMNAQVALERAKIRKMSNGKVDRKLIAEIKAEIAAMQLEVKVAAAEMANAYENAMIKVRNHVHGVDVMIPRYNKGSVCDPSMDAYHQM